MLPRLQFGCCGSSLHTSSLVIGWIQVILSTFGILLFSFLGTAVLQYATNDNDPNLDPEKKEQLEQVIAIAFAVVLVFLVFGLLINGSLLWGVYKRNYCLMMPYLILAGAGNVLNILSTILTFFAAFTNPQLFLQFIFNGVFTAVGCYCWLILYSYHQEVKDTALMNQNTFRKV